MVEVKICGVCRAEDARTAGEAGAAWVGVILTPGRTRSQSPEGAAAILDAGGVRRAGVFVDETVRAVIDTAVELELDAVQLHGDETPEMAAEIREAVRGEVWKAVRVRAPSDVVRSAALYGSSVDALLLDGWAEDAHGGTGTRFDWHAVAGSARPGDMRLIVAGGLNPDNVAQAVRVLRPAVVDVSSGVESAPGRKSPDRIRAFIAAAHGVRLSDDR
jgi:phosphoribosylanthranilate isomerase